jgi:hypothetical protein
VAADPDGFRIAFWVYGALWLVAAIGTQGLFGTSPDPFAALFLILLGLPWSPLLAPLTYFGAPVIVSQICIVLMPGLNIFVLWRLFRDERRRFPEGD